MYPLTSACPQDRVSAQAGFSLKKCERDLPQSFSQVLTNNTAILVPH
jgi:hypothetical protein